MFVKLAILTCSLALASTASYNGPLAGGQPAALYPAGVDPKACPNFPICGNPAVAVNQIPEANNVIHQQYQPQYQAQSQYQGQSQYQPQPQYHASSQYQPQYNPTPQQYAQAASASHYPSQIQEALNRGEYIGDGDYHGEGLAEALAPGYEGRQQQAYNAAPAAYQQAVQYNKARALQYNAAPATPYNPVPAAVQYNQAPAGAINYHGVNPVPAGVDPSSCPNYPFCS